MQAELVKRAQSGDRDAFDALARAAYDRMYTVAQRILRDGSAAEDAVQDALIRAWRDLRSLRRVDAFEAWTHRLLVNACYDQARRSRRMVSHVAELDLQHSDPHDQYAVVAHRDELDRAFLKLSIEQRAVVVLTHYLGLSAPEVGDVLGIPVGTVYSRLHYSLRILRDSISGEQTALSPTLEKAR